METEQKRGMGTGAKIGLGCGIGCLVVILLLVVGGFVAWRVVQGKINDATKELAEKGFTNVKTGQMLDVNEPVTEKTLFRGQVVRLMSDCATDVAILAQAAEIHGTVEGRVYFRGQVLTIQPRAVVKNGLDANGQIVQVLGQLDGEVTGSAKVVRTPRATPSAAAPAPLPVEAKPAVPAEATP